MDLPLELARAARTQRGVFTTAQALAADVCDDEIRRRVRTGQWRRIRRGAFTAQDWAGLDDERRHELHARAVMLRAGRSSALSHHSAAVLHGLRLHSVPLDVIHVTHPCRRGSARRERDVQHHEADLPDDEVAVVGGVRVTEPVRTVMDLARSVPDAAAVVALDGVLAAGVPRAELLAMHVRHLDWPGSRAAGRALAAADGRSESVGETRLRLGLTAVGWPPDALQHELLTEVGLVRTDLAWRARRLVGEFDGRVKYGRLLRPGETAEDVLVRERRRELAIERAGWCVVRFTWADLRHPDVLAGRVADAVERARRYAS